MLLTCCLVSAQTEAAKIENGTVPMTVDHDDHKWGAFNFNLQRHEHRRGFFVIGTKLLGTPRDFGPGGVFVVEPLLWYPFGHVAVEYPLSVTSATHELGFAGFVSLAWRRQWSDNMSTAERTVTAAFALPYILPRGTPVYVQCVTIDASGSFHASTAWRIARK